MSSDEEKIIRVVKNATDLQRLKIEKLMRNPEKPAFIPEKTRDKKFPKPPEFVRNVMGSSAGAGSGEFHVYRHIRRREYARQEYLSQLSEKDRLDLEYREKVDNNQRITDGKAAKKRAKRQRTKQRLRDKRKKGKNGQPVKDSVSSESASESEDGCDDETSDKKGADESNSEATAAISGCASLNSDEISKENSIIPPEDSLQSSIENKSTSVGNSESKSAIDSPEKTAKKSLKELLIRSTAKLPASMTLLTGDK